VMRPLTLTIAIIKEGTTQRGQGHKGHGVHEVHRVPQVRRPR
jgi:hypothetical protein